MTLADPKFISLTTIQVGKKIKDKKERVSGSASYKQKGLNLVFLNFLTSAWSFHKNNDAEGKFII
jgi:hypothetical protein